MPSTAGAISLCQFATELTDGYYVEPDLNGQGCARIRETGGQDQYFCVLKFDYRADAARVTYQGYVDELDACFGKKAQVPVGPAVNHPDSFDQTMYQVKGKAVSVSLKDRSWRKHTYVSVRLPAN